MFLTILIYGVVAIFVFLTIAGIEILKDIENEDKDRITLPHAVCYSVFWIFYLIFYLPKIIVAIAKFIVDVFKTLFEDLKKINK